MKALECDLESLLQGTRQYVVPSFQPPYRWSRERRETFLSGVLESFQHYPEREIFFGALVLMPIESKPLGLDKSLIVDGHQRLLTMLALLAALRDAVRARNPELSERIRRECLLNVDLEGYHRFKVLAGVKDRAAFSEALGETCDSLTAFEVARFFLDRLEQELELEEGAFYGFLLNRLMIVRIDLEKDENPYPIFRSLQRIDITEPSPGIDTYQQFADDPGLMAMIAGGESDELEFKEAMIRRDATERDIERQGAQVVRSVAGFMNSSSGGTLLIGVGDDGSIRGVNREYRLVNRGRANWDGYVLNLRNMLRSRLDVANSFRFYAIRRHTIGGRDVCRIDIRPSDSPVYVKKHLYVRSGNQTIEMRGPDLVDYVHRRWGDSRPDETEAREEF